MYNKGLYSDWVPKPVQLLLIVLLLAVVMPIGGVYTGNISYLVSGTGAMTEYFMWANYDHNRNGSLYACCSQNQNEIQGKR
jgi:hypothetical protein